jgi:uncharacterized protein YbjT (DUF2867 family)
MRILVTGGTGVVGRSTVTALIQRGHVVHLLSRHTRRDAEQWAHGVYPVPADVTEPASVAGAADGCDVVLHLTGTVHERDGATLKRINVDGTRNILLEAVRAGVKRFVYVSSLGADSGTSEYHASKRAAEELTRGFPGAWTIVRPGSVYGPGDEQISLLLRMVRTLPVIPTLGAGDQRFQPIWHEDLAEALAAVAERADLAGRVLEVAGNDVTSQAELVERLSLLTGRRVRSMWVPELLTGLTLRAAAMLGIDTPFTENQLKMLRDGNVILPGRENALSTVLGVEPTALDAGLRKLAEAQDEQLPDDGVGALRRKRYWADIQSSAMTPEGLMDHVRANFGRLMALFIGTHAEPNSTTMLDEDATITLALPLRGHIQVRVAESEPRVVTLISLAGHPLSGAVRFLTEQRGDAVRFEVQVFDRASNIGDFIVMRTVGEPVQDTSWRRMIDNVVRESGGTTARVQEETESLDQDQAERIEEWLRDLVMERRRERAAI